MKRSLLIIIAIVATTTTFAQQRFGHGFIGVGALYERGMDATIGYEYETKYHNSFEVFANVYSKYKKCETCDHYCRESLFNNYNSYGVGLALKPCVTRTRNQHGNVRLGASLGSDTKKIVTGVHVGYEQTYAMRAGWQLYWQVKGDVMINGKDLLRTGVVLGVKLPVKQ